MAFGVHALYICIVITALGAISRCIGGIRPHEATYKQACGSTGASIVAIAYCRTYSCAQHGTYNRAAGKTFVSRLIC